MSFIKFLLFVAKLECCTPNLPIATMTINCKKGFSSKSNDVHVQEMTKFSVCMFYKVV